MGGDASGLRVAQRQFYPVGAATKAGFARYTIRRLAAYDDPNFRTYADSELYWDKIVSIEYVGEKPTYDLEIPGTHNFIANDILVHNSHAADYAVITVQTAYLKAHYPVEYMAAQLLVERDKTEKVINFVSECRRMGVDVLPPDVNYSGLDFEIQLRPPDTPTWPTATPAWATPSRCRRTAPSASVWLPSKTWAKGRSRSSSRRDKLGAPSRAWKISATGSICAR